MSTLQIFDQWSTYEKIVVNDYMHHREFFQTLMDEVEARLVQPLSIIDIGCGDAQPVLALLGRFQIDRYVGIDQSQAALGLAHKALMAINVSHDLRPGPMLEELRKIDGKFDLAIASYALHHLDSNEKQAALTECRQLLRPDAMLAVIDVFREEDESRSAYFERWQKNARRSFTALASDELEELLEHVRSCDIPEMVSDYRQFGKSAGFTTVASLLEDRGRLNKLVVLY